ncbi:MAG: carbon storage regulator CsrA [Anaerolineales bacterium]
MLVLSRGPEEAIIIGAEVEVKVLEVRGDRVRLGIIAPASVSVHRKEVYLSIQRENWAASASEAEGLAGAVEILGRGAMPSPAGASQKPKTARNRGKVVG